MIDMNAAVPMIKLAPDLLVPVDSLPEALKRRWQQAQSKAANGEDMRQALKTIVRDAQAALGPDILLRAAHKVGGQSIMTLGMEHTEHQGAKLKSLSAEAAALADQAKKQEGIKQSAGKRVVE